MYDEQSLTSHPTHQNRVVITEGETLTVINQQITRERQPSGSNRPQEHTLAVEKRLGNPNLN